MQFLRNIVMKFKRGRGSEDTYTPSPTASPRTLSIDLSTYAPTAMTIATVFRCVDLLSKSVANLPLMFLEKRDGVFVPDYGRMNYLLQVQPDETKNAFDFWKEVISDVLVSGNAYILPIYSAHYMDVERFVLCSRGSVVHDTIRDTYSINDIENHICGIYKESDIIHLKGYTIDGKTGLSVLSYARMAIQIASAGDKETKNRFSSTVSGLVTNTKGVTGFGEYQDKELSAAADDIDAEFRSGKKIVSVPGMAEFKQLTMTSSDMQFLESRKFTVREICRFFGVHPSYVFDDTSNNYKSAEMASVAFLSTTLNPILRQIELEFLRKLISPNLFGKQKFEFDRDALYACDLESKAKYQTDTIASGLYTVNEWRIKENKKPVKDGDTPLVSANLRRILD